MNVCSESLRMLCLDVLGGVLVQVEMDNRPLLKRDQDDRANHGCELFTHVPIYYNRWILPEIVRVVQYKMSLKRRSVSSTR